MGNVIEEAFSMKPGRELDKLIAEKVMGWTRRICGKVHHYSPLWVNLPEPKPCTDMYWIDAGGKECDYLPSYSTDIGDAWEVVEKLSYKDTFVIYRALSGPWIAMNGPTVDNSTVVEYAETAPHAISLAALQASSIT